MDDNNEPTFFDNFKDLLLKIDIFEKSPKLGIYKKSLIKTFVGSVFTILIIFFSIALFIYFGLNVVLRSKPTYIFSVLNSNTPPPIIVSPSNFSFAISVEDKITLNYYIDETIYTVNASVSYGVKTGQNWAFKKVYLDIGRCSVPLFPESYQSRLSNGMLNNMYCFTNPNQTILFNGTFPSNKFTQINLYFNGCKNSSSNNYSCKPQEVIDSKLDGAMVSVQYTEISIDPLNIYQPNQVLMGNFFQVTSNNYITEIFQNIKNVIVKSDFGYVFESINTENFILVEDPKIFNTFTTPVDFYFRYFIQLSSEIHVYTRTYTKAQEVAAQVGGSINFLIIIGNILTFYFKDFVMGKFLSNEIFEFYEKKLLNKSAEIKNNKIMISFDRGVSPNNQNNVLNTMKLNENYNLTAEDMKNQSMNLTVKKREIQFDEIPEHRLKSSKNHLELDNNELLTLLFCPCYSIRYNPKIEFLSRINFMLLDKLDFRKFLSLPDEFKVLLHLIFDKHQLSLFKILRKTPIYDLQLEKNKSNNIKTFISFRENQNQENIEAYENVRNRINSKESIDFKIIDLLHQA